MKTIISIEGVLPRKRAEARKEIREYLALFEKSFNPEKINISRVIVAGDFQRTVNTLLPDLTEKGFSYQAKHRSVKAVGKTIPGIKENGISFTVAIDGKYIGNWESDEKATRFELFFHEFIHAFLFQKRFANMGVNGFKNDYRTIEGVCFSLALTRDEYIVDSYLDVICKKSLTDEKGEPLGLKKLNMGRGIDYPEIFMRLLNDMPGFIRTRIMEFKTGKKSTGEAWNALCAFIEEILTAFAHLAGSQEKEADWDSVQKTISDNEAYRQYLAGRLKKIYLEWINYFDADHDEAKSLEIIGNEILEIFHNCGLRFSNVSEGINITLNLAG